MAFTFHGKTALVTGAGQGMHNVLDVRSLTLILGIVDTPTCMIKSVSINTTYII